MNNEPYKLQINSEITISKGTVLKSFPLMLSRQLVGHLTNSSNAEVEAELRGQLLVGLQSALKINNLYIFYEKFRKK